MRAIELPPIVRKAHEYAAEGYRLFEVAQMIAQDFNIKPPSDSTLCRWHQEANASFLADIKGFQARRTFMLLDRNDRLRRKFLPIALAQEMPITRFRMEDGQRVPWTDEDAYAETVKAAEVVLKCDAVEMKLLGLEGGAGIAIKEDGEQSQADLFAFIGRMAAQAIAEREGRATSPFPTLELRSGVQDTYLTNEQPK